MKQKRWVHIYVFYVNTHIEVGLKAFWDSSWRCGALPSDVVRKSFVYRFYFLRTRESKCRYMPEQFHAVLLLDIHNNVCFA